MVGERRFATRSRIRRCTSRARASDADARSLGYVVAWFVADEGEIANLAVAPTGVGKWNWRALLDAALAKRRLADVAAVYLEVRDSNERARGCIGRAASRKWAGDAGIIGARWRTPSCYGAR